MEARRASPTTRRRCCWPGSDLPEPAGGQEAEAILAEFEAAGAREAVVSTDAVEAEALFDARRLAYPALEQRGDAVLTEDVCLPRGRLAEMLARVDEIAARATTSSSPTSPTPATATCTRC